MLKKIDQEKFRAIIELYEYSGNLEPNIKKLLLEISRLCTTMPMDKELLIELYRLNNILNPEKNDLKSLGEILEDEW
ncbi:MAG: hypothetical protein L6244_06425 [Candidatus Methanoperedenaceae archaeon]|nr:hypothetical protein [Candidatus Methanoperedenaceae archaeon]